VIGIIIGGAVLMLIGFLLGERFNVWWTNRKWANLRPDERRRFGVFCQRMADLQEGLTWPGDFYAQAKGDEETCDERG